MITKVLGLKKAVCKIEEMHAALASLDDTDKPCALLQLFREALSSPMIDELRSKIDMVLDDSSASSAGNAVSFGSCSFDLVALVRLHSVQTHSI